jgi:hypothetical protein
MSKIFATNRFVITPAQARVIAGIRCQPGRTRTNPASAIRQKTAARNLLADDRYRICRWFWQRPSFQRAFLQRYQMAPGSVRRAADGRGEGILLRLAYRPPYAWDAVISYLRGRAMPGLEAVIQEGQEGDQAAYVRSVRIQGSQAG